MSVMTDDDANLLEAVLHHVNILLGSDQPGNLSRERDLTNVKKCLRVSEGIIKGTASAEEKKSVVEDLMHPQVRSLYKL